MSFETEFTEFLEDVTLKRINTGGGYIKGFFYLNAPVLSTIKASVQTWRGFENENTEDRKMFGRDVKGDLVFYTSTKLNGIDNLGQKQADILIYRGKEYEVKEVTDNSNKLLDFSYFINVACLKNTLQEGINPFPPVPPPAFDGHLVINRDVDINGNLEVNGNADINGSLEYEPYVHNQTTYSALWVVNHNLNKPYPNVVVIDESNEVIEVYWESIDNNTLHIKPDLSIKGKAYIS